MTASSYQKEAHWVGRRSSNSVGSAASASGSFFGDLPNPNPTQLRFLVRVAPTFTGGPFVVHIEGRLHIDAIQTKQTHVICKQK